MDAVQAALAGTVLGALITAGASWLTERSRRMAEDRHRFSEHKRELYGAFVAVSYELSASARAMARGGKEWTPESRRAFVAIEGSSGRVYDLRGQLQVVAPEAVVTAADELILLVPDLIEALADAFDEEPPGERALKATRVLEAYRDARRVAVNAIRDDLGVSRLTGAGL